MKNQASANGGFWHFGMTCITQHGDSCSNCSPNTVATRSTASDSWNSLKHNRCQPVRWCNTQLTCVVEVWPFERVWTVSVSYCPSGTKSWSTARKTWLCSNVDESSDLQRPLESALGMNEFTFNQEVCVCLILLSSEQQLFAQKTHRRQNHSRNEGGITEWLQQLDLSP